MAGTREGAWLAYLDSQDAQDRVPRNVLQGNVQEMTRRVDRDRVGVGCPVRRQRYQRVALDIECGDGARLGGDEQSPIPWIEREDVRIGRQRVGAHHSTRPQVDDSKPGIPFSRDVGQTMGRVNQDPVRSLDSGNRHPHDNGIRHGIDGRELVQGLTHDLLARSDRYWQLIAQPPLLTFDRAARRALAEESRARQLGAPVRALESVVDLVAGRC